jgi:hypothetical protein
VAFDSVPNLLPLKLNLLKLVHVLLKSAHRLVVETLSVVRLDLRRELDTVTGEFVPQCWHLLGAS